MAELNTYYGFDLPTVADVIGSRPEHAIITGGISFDDKVYSFRCERLVARKEESASSPSSSVAYHAEASPAFPPHQAPPPRPERKPEGDGDEGASERGQS